MIGRSYWVSKASELVKKLIEKRKLNNKKHRAKIVDKVGIDKLVCQFIKKIEQVSTESTNVLAFEAGIEEAAKWLFNYLKSIDSGVNFTLKWADESNVSNWQDLTIDGVYIKWSDRYQCTNPTISAELYIDVMYLMLNGFLDED
jgi:hypothetical protein